MQLIQDFIAIWEVSAWRFFDKERSALKLGDFGISSGSDALYLMVFLFVHISASDRECNLLYKMLVKSVSVISQGLVEVNNKDSAKSIIQQNMEHT